MPPLALSDLIAPYLLLGRLLGGVHAVLDVLNVDEYEATTDALGGVVRGRGRFGVGSDVYLDPRSMALGTGADGGHPRDDPARRDPWIDIADTTVDFELVAPRQGSGTIAAAHGNLAATPGFNATQAVLNAWGGLPLPAPPTDYPSSGFTLDLLLTSAVIRPPFLEPARLGPDGRLEPDPARTWVALTLPRILIRMTQASALNAPLQVALLTAGASGLDDPGDPRVFELVRMDPPYAFIGPGRLVGFGFRSAVLDLSTGSTPPDVLAQSGYGDGWTGVYFPEIRLFVAPQGAEGLAVDAGARNLLIGIGATPGVTGDFELEVINQGTGPLELGARFYDADGVEHGITRLDDDSAEVTLAERSTMVVDVSGGRPPYTTSISLDGGATFVTERVIDVDMSAATERTIVLRASAPGSPDAELTIAARRRPPPPVPTTTVPRAVVTASEATRGGAPVAGPALVIDAQSDTTVTLRMSDSTPVSWEVDSSPAGAGAAVRVTVPLAAGERVAVRATAPGVESTLPVYFHFDEPPNLPDADLEAWSRNPSNTNTTEAVDEPPSSGWTGGVTPVESDPGYALGLAQLSPDGSVRVVGHASSEYDPAAATYNLLLSERRAKVARFIYERIAAGRCDPDAVDPHGFTDAQPQQDLGSPRRHWWRAELPNPVTIPELIVTGAVARDPIPESPAPKPVDPPTETPEKPGWLRSIGVRVRIVRDEFVALELHGEIDVETATEQALRERAPDDDMPEFAGLGHQNPGDGIVAFRGVFTLDPGEDRWALDLTFGADPSDVDGLVMTGAPSGQTAERSLGRDVLGLYTLFLPLIAEVAPESPADATVAQLVLTGALATLPVTLAGVGWMTVERWILYGGEVLILERDGSWSTSVLLDVETAVSADIDLGGRSLVTIRRDRPLVARYKAIGFRFGVAPDGDLLLHPVFDSSRGYTLDIARGGSLEVAEPLGSILRVVSARVSRTNPVLFEIELTAAVDLGVVTLETCAVRVTLDTDASVELTALGASLDVPGAVTGSGYFQIAEDGFAGRIDLTIVPIALRVAAALNVRAIPGPPDGPGPATAVAVALEVRFPVAIPLANSGMGIYGLIGLFAMHFTRNEAPDAASATKALSWLARAEGDPTQVDDPTLWTPEIDHWAFGVGAIVGTMGSSVLLNMKGVVLLELPGPRVLLMMKANLLMPMPELAGTGEGTLLAVVDLDVAGGSLTIGIVVDYGIEPLLHVRIPIEAFFDTDEPEDWHVYVGKFAEPVTADVLGVFSGTGYVMLVGDGGTNPDLPPSLPHPSGFAVAVGLHVSMLWGSRPAKIYATLAAGFDAILGFTPLLVAGTLEARGEMRLVVASIAAHTNLDVRLGELADGSTGYEIEGEVCGSIDLFFFDIEACVDFRLASGAPPEIAIRALVNGVSLVGRSPALVQGTGSDQPVDAALADAVAADAEPDWDALPAEQRAAAEIPIDAIPVVMFDAPPFEAAGLTFEGQPLGGAAGGRTVQRSDDRIDYTLASVQLLGPLSPGAAPATWWTLRPPNEANESAQLALLSWVPDPTPKALQGSELRDQTVSDRWGTVCSEVAPPAPVLWTFLAEPLGPDARGWQLDGVPWRDPRGSVRSAPPPVVLEVSERWRSGDPVADGLRGIAPAEVVGARVFCPPDPGPPTPPGGAPSRMPPGRPARRRPEPIAEAGLGAPELLRRLDAGVPIGRAAFAPATVVAPRDGPARPGCVSRVLAAPRFDSVEPVPRAARAKREEVLARWDARGFEPGDLVDAVVLRPGPFEGIRVLLLVDPLALDGGLRVRALTPDGAIADEHAVNNPDIVSWATLPRRWTDPSGAWAGDVFLVSEQLLLLARDQRVPVLVTLEGRGEADRVVVGGVPERDWATQAIGPPYYVAVVEALLAAERTRFDYDSSNAQSDRDVLAASLGAASGDVALLEPDTAYEIRVTWSASASNSRGDSATQPDTLERFWFRTAADPPERLDPWILASVPYEGERHVFGDEPLQLAFATQDVVDLYEAFGDRLEVRLQAASGDHPGPAAGLPYPFPLNADTVEEVAASVLSPWEDAAVRLAAGLDCVEVDEERVRHSVVTIPIPLQASTDYLLDVVRVPRNAVEGAPGERVFRRAFTTSAYGSLAALGASLQGTRVGHRSAPAGAFAAISVALATDVPEGEQLDAALEASGLARLPVPPAPQALVFWEGEGEPVPTALVIDGTEPLWRERERATLVTLAGTDISHWELRRDSWVEPEVTGGEATVTRIIRAPGGQRAVLLLGAGARGGDLHVALRRRAFTESYLDGAAATDELQPIVDVSLARAPWEEDA